MVIKNLENKIKLVMIICALFLAGCIVISLSSIWTARYMVVDATHHHGGDPRCGSQEPCRNVPPLLLHARSR